MKKALTINASVPLDSLPGYIEGELRDSEWVVTAVLWPYFNDPDRAYIERMIAITPDAFKQHNHG